MHKLFSHLNLAKYPPHFANGIPIAPVIIDYYENLPQSLKEKWTSIADTRFYEWLQEPSPDDPLFGQTAFPISRLAAYIWEQNYFSLKPPLGKTLLPDIYGQNRITFLHWLSIVGKTQGQSDEAFVKPSRDLIEQWYSQIENQNFRQLLQKHPTTNERQLRKENLKILIVSSPRTGNNWLKAIFAHLYNLPARDILSPAPNLSPTKQAELERFGIDLEMLENLGSKWVAYSHFHLRFPFIEWAKKHGIKLVTTVRHPADTLLSLYHFVNDYKTQADFDPILLTMLASDAGITRNSQAKVPLRTGILTYAPPENTLTQTVESGLSEYVRRYYFDLLYISVNWWRSGASLGVRYEDLWAAPLVTLEKLTAAILPKPREELQRALMLADFKLMQKLAGKDQRFFRQGGSGNGLNTLPSEIIEIMRNTEPYLTIAKELGYSFEAANPVKNLSQEAADSHDFLKKLGRLHYFDNGSPIAPILLKCYLVNWLEFKQRWPLETLTATGAGTFFAWLTEPYKPLYPKHKPAEFISNLAWFIYQERQDVQQAFPQIASKDKAAFLDWFKLHGGREFGLDSAWVSSEF